MITSLPAVQFSCRWARRVVSNGRSARRSDKREANRCHRRALNRATRAMRVDPDRFYDETFNAPSLSDWDIA
jgi:hypothetical protein